MGIVRSSLAALAIGFIFATPAFADPAEDATNGFNAETKGDFATALRLYRVAALAGNPYAQGNLGNMLRAGRGTTPRRAHTGPGDRRDAAPHPPLREAAGLVVQAVSRSRLARRVRYRRDGARKARGSCTG